MPKAKTTNIHLSHVEMLERGEKAIAQAQDVRSYHRKRTRIGHPQRNTDILHAMQKVQAAMRPIRSALGRAPYQPLNETSRSETDELKAMSKRVQAERRKLWKLRGGKNFPRRWK